jgi:serine/threonine-protein kinase HipA
MIQNTDGHLRNHGFFIDARGVRLSPAYDMNPSIDRAELSLAINELDTACDVAIAMDAFKDYGLTKEQTAKVHQEVQVAVATWRKEASRLRISRDEQDLMERAFEH